MLFYEAVRQGYVPDSEAGLGLLLEWLSPGTSTRLAAGLYAFQAFLTKWYQVPFASAVGQARADPAWLAAVQAEYGQTAAPVVAPVAPTPPVQPIWTPGVQIVVDYAAPPSPGDGINFATVAWRSIEQDLKSAAWRGSSPWVRWANAFVHRTNDQRIVVLDLKHVLYEAHNYQGVPGRIAPMWDVASLDAAVAGSGPGSPPPALAAVVITPPSQVIPTIPSGSIPVPSSPMAPTPIIGPTIDPWVDIAVPSGPTILPPPIIGTLGPGGTIPAGGGMSTTGTAVAIVGGPAVGGKPSPPAFLVMDEEPRAKGPGLALLLGGLGLWWLASRRMPRRG